MWINMEYIQLPYISPNYFDSFVSFLPSLYVHIQITKHILNLVTLRNINYDFRSKCNTCINMNSITLHKNHQLPIVFNVVHSRVIL